MPMPLAPEGSTGHGFPDQHIHRERWAGDKLLDGAGRDAADAVGLAAIEAEGELVEVGLQVFRTLTVELERLEAKFATAGQAEVGELALYNTTSNTLKRLLEAVGLRRRPRDVTPDLHHYISGQANEGP